MKKLEYDEILAHVISNKLFRNPNICLSCLAKRFMADQEKITQIIVKGAGKGFQELITDLRLKEARDLLLDEIHADFSTEAIGRMAGFEDRLQFKNLFEECTGYTPAEYKRLYL